MTLIKMAVSGIVLASLVGCAAPSTTLAPSAPVSAPQAVELSSAAPVDAYRMRASYGHEPVLSELGR